jgi:hypothetical protein
MEPIHIGLKPENYYALGGVLEVLDIVGDERKAFTKYVRESGHDNVTIYESEISLPGHVAISLIQAFSMENAEL